MAKRTKAFAGYAPVLSAYIEATNRLTSSDGQEAWGVMETVIDQILNREQEKLKTPLRGQCRTALPDSVYDKQEQLALVAQYIDGRPLEGAKRVNLPPTDMAKYQDMIRTQLTDHPFVRLKEFSNAVFGSVVLAHAICHGQNVSPDRLITLSRQPFIWRAISRLLANPSLIDGNLVGYILDSFWNDQLTNEVAPVIYMRPSDNEGAAHIQISPARTTPLSFDAVLPIKFYGTARSCDVDIAGKIILRGAGGRGSGRTFRLQDFALICDTLEVEADSVRLEGNVWMESQEISAPPHLRLIRNGAKVGWGGQFAVQFPWNKEAADLPAPYANQTLDRLTRLVNECAIRFPAGITLILNPDFSPVRDDPQTRWIMRHFSTEFPRLINLMHDHSLASSDPTFGAGSGKVKVRFSTNWIDFLRALKDPLSSPISRDFIDQARREIG